MFKILIPAVLAIVLISCLGIQPDDGIAFYKVGDKVQIFIAPEPCYAVITAYDGNDTYTLDVICAKYTGSYSHGVKIHASGIERKLK